MVSKPKPCKYGCNTVITWDETNRFFKGPDGQKHDCRDWPGVGTGVQQQNVAPNNFSNPQLAPPTGETLIGVQAKKTWENYFKFLEVIAANTAAIASSLETTNKLLIENGEKIKSLDDTLVVTKTKVEAENEA